MTSNSKRRLPPMSDEGEADIQAGIAADPDAREATDEELAAMRPASEVLPPALFAALTRRGRPKADAPKVAISLRVDPDVLEAYKATGDGWQTRMQTVLAEGIGRSGVVTGRTSVFSGNVRTERTSATTGISGSYEVVGPRGEGPRRSPGSKKRA